MTDEVKAQQGPDWKRFLRKHWKVGAIFAMAGVFVLIGAIYVFLWFVWQAQTTGLVPSSLGLWTMGNIVMFILYAVFWELVFIGIPAAIGAAVGWQWWRMLPEEEKREYIFTRRRSSSRGAGGAIGPLLFIAFAFKVYFDGNWGVAISTWTLDYVVGSLVTILIWVAVIFGIPVAIGGLWWLRHEMNKQT
jgi:hypothetical protein